MEAFHYQEGRLYVEGVALADIAASVGTPVYVYSRSMIEERWRAYDEAFSGRDHLVCYAVKANSNLAVLKLLADLGSGFDIVSAGELERVLRAGGDPGRIVFSGVGKTEAEMRRALEVGIGCFNVESEGELERLNDVAGDMGLRAPVSLRINPDVDPHTHPYISTGLKESKFGIPIDDGPALYDRARGMANIEIRGVASHIGSQLTEIEPFVDALERVISLVGELIDAGIELQWLDLGGGLGIRYFEEEAPEPTNLVVTLMDHLQEVGTRYQRMRVLIEPGRSIIGNAGVLLTRVQYLKPAEVRNFAIVDAAMNDLIRPALYDAWQDIVVVDRSVERNADLYDVVGPVCESGDFLGRDRELAIAPGDLLAVASAGAYGASMSSNYNSRPRAAEVIVDGDRFHVVRQRETIDELMADEAMLPS
jgi:diaminopimelate decarboxylase